MPIMARPRPTLNPNDFASARSCPHVALRPRGLSLCMARPLGTFIPIGISPAQGEGRQPAAPILDRFVGKRCRTDEPASQSGRPDLHHCFLNSTE
jgi:hypothetical protein